MEWGGQNLACANWASSFECHHVCMVIANAENTLGVKFPQLAADLVRQNFLPKASVAIGFEDAKVCLLSAEGDKVHGVDVLAGSTRNWRSRRLQTLSISPLDGTLAWAHKYGDGGAVFMRKPHEVTSELHFALGRVFALAFVRSRTLLVVGLVNNEDESSVVLYDYASSLSIVSLSLHGVDAVKYDLGGFSVPDGELAVANNGLFFGVADGWNLTAWDFAEGRQLLQHNIEPVGLAFTLDSCILTAATKEMASEFRFRSFTVVSGEPASDHYMHMKHVTGTDARAMLYTNFSFIVFVERSMVVINPVGEVVLNIVVPFQRCGPAIALAIVPERVDDHTRFEQPYATFIQPVDHEEEEAAIIGVLEAAEIVAVQEACFVELNVDAEAETDTAKRFHVCTLNRCPKELRDRLCKGPQLKHVRDALGDQKWMGPGGSLIFVEPEWIELVLNYLERERVQLHPSNLCISATYVYLVEEVMDMFRKVWCKNNEEIEISADDSWSLDNNGEAESAVSGSSCHFSDQRQCVDIENAEGGSSVLRNSCSVSAPGLSSDVELVYQKTFVHIVKPAAADDTATQSTTQLHCPMQVNPRMPSRQL